MLMLLTAQQQAGAGDPSAAYLDPVLAYMTGSYTPETRWSDDEILAISAPTLSAYTQLDPQGRLVPKAGLDKTRLKQIESILSGEAPYDIAADRTDREEMDFLQSLAEENAKFTQQKLSRDSRKDQFEEMGFPGYGKGYSDEQIFSMYGDYLGDTPQRMARSEQEAARLVARNKKLLQPFEPATEATSDYEKLKKKSAPATNVAAEIDRLKKEEAAYASKGDAARQYSAYRKRVALEQGQSKNDPNVAAFKALLESETTRAGYSPGGTQYEALRAQVQARKLAAALEAAGRTPLSDALTSAAMLKRVLGR